MLMDSMLRSIDIGVNIGVVAAVSDDTADMPRKGAIDSISSIPTSLEGFHCGGDDAFLIAWPCTAS